VTQWFLCLFINLLPIEIAMRFLDSFFYDGNIMLFRIALALFSKSQKILLNTNDLAEIMVLCRNLPESVTDPNLLFEHAYQLKISEQKLTEYRKQGLVIVEQKK